MCQQPAARAADTGQAGAGRACAALLQLTELHHQPITHPCQRARTTVKWTTAPEGHGRRCESLCVSCQAPSAASVEGCTAGLDSAARASAAASSARAALPGAAALSGAGCAEVSLLPSRPTSSPLITFTLALLCLLAGKPTYTFTGSRIQKQTTKLEEAIAMANIESAFPAMLAHALTQARRGEAWRRGLVCRAGWSRHCSVGNSPLLLLLLLAGLPSRFLKPPPARRPPVAPTTASVCRSRRMLWAASTRRP